MEFEFTSSIWINGYDLEQMCHRVKQGEDFLRVFDDIMMGYEDSDYYASEFIFEDVKAEVMARIKAEGN